MSVNSTERRQLLQNELTTLGSNGNISEEAGELESQIAQSETVSALFSSPLTIRLFTPVLRKSGVTATVTLGEILLDVLHERMSGWISEISSLTTSQRLKRPCHLPSPACACLGTLLPQFLKNPTYGGIGLSLASKHHLLLQPILQKAS